MHPAVAFAVLFAFSTAVWVVALFVYSGLIGGLDFGRLHLFVLKSAGLLLAVNLITLIPYGGYFTIVVWWLGLMLVLKLDFWEARNLVIILWLLNLLAWVMLFQFRGPQLTTAPV